MKKGLQIVLRDKFKNDVETAWRDVVFFMVIAMKEAMSKGSRKSIISRSGLSKGSKKSIISRSTLARQSVISEIKRNSQTYLEIMKDGGGEDVKEQSSGDKPRKDSSTVKCETDKAAGEESIITSKPQAAKKNKSQFDITEEDEEVSDDDSTKTIEMKAETKLSSEEADDEGESTS